MEFFNWASSTAFLVQNQYPDWASPKSTWAGPPLNPIHEVQAFSVILGEGKSSTWRIW